MSAGGDSPGHRYARPALSFAGKKEGKKLWVDFVWYLLTVTIINLTFFGCADFYQFFVFHDVR
jgi:hypothetical protein